MALFVAMAGVGAGVGMGIDASKKTEVVLPPSALILLSSGLLPC